MPRRPKPEDIDFEIHVDPSCLSTEQEGTDDDLTMSGRPSLTDEGTGQTDAIEELENQIREHLDQALESEKALAESNEDATGEIEDQAESRRQSTMSENEADTNQDDAQDAQEDPSFVSGEEQAETSVLSTDDNEPAALSVQDDPAGAIMQSIEDDSLIDNDADARGTETTPTDDDENTETRLQTPEPTSHRPSHESITSTASSPRRASGRTEALIHAAARDIVAQIEQGQDLQSVTEDDASFVSETETVERTRNSEAFTFDDSRRSSGSVREAEQTRSADEGADSSSHHENEDDVFSDHSPRSSIGSASDAAASDADVRKMDENVTRRSRTRSPRMSGVSGVSELSHYQEDEEDFIPTIRGTPRPAFRSPSSVKAIQMSSPPASVFGSPRSSRRTPMQTVSRLGSPGISAQYSPKKTPPRFKRNTPPLVLLHVTLLPLRWGWGDVLDDAEDDELSPDGKNLRDAWRQLQDRMGDTTCERGILLPHPQNDYEVLEERLLEALELPLRRRARILECGHYLGPANEMNMLDDIESDEDFDDEDTNFVVHSPGGKTHWCSTCRSDIRYDSLGAGKVFRVKVYASNGLMKAGAWDTCWKEMERVDVEIEPLVELGLQHELSKLQAEQERRLDEAQAVEVRGSLPHDAEYEQDEENDEAAHPVEEEPCYMDEEPLPQEEPSLNNMPESTTPAPSPDQARRIREEERLREIYGHSPPATHPEPDSPDPSFTAHTSPASPSVEAFERRQQRAHAAQTMKAASLPELLLESVRVLMQDRKNVVILVMGLLVAFLALNNGGGGAQARSADAARDIERLVERREAVQMTREMPTAVIEETPSVVDMPLQSSIERADSASASPASAETGNESAVDPCSSSRSDEASASVSREVVRVVETVTETSFETATVTQTLTAVETEPVAEELTLEPSPAPDESPIEEVIVEEEEAKSPAQEPLGADEDIAEEREEL